MEAVKVPGASASIFGSGHELLLYFCVLSQLPSLGISKFSGFCCWHSTYIQVKKGALWQATIQYNLFAPVIYDTNYKISVAQHLLNEFGGLPARYSPQELKYYFMPPYRIIRRCQVHESCICSELSLKTCLNLSSEIQDLVSAAAIVVKSCLFHWYY